MQTKARVLLDRMVTFGTRAAVVARSVRREIGGDHIARQLVRSASSAPANYAEACDAESRADFIHKLKVALKEMRESYVWLRFVHGLRPTPESQQLISECNELIAILVASAKTTQSGRVNRRSEIPNPKSRNR